ncbi:hypothetical protein DRP43_04345 [candidate division TA06 bacterium]|mgnify:CR=1 FL=1|uniref:Uncharacterized protein n=1 Tax=candidate division TA06 bacterium TaxID=2250710 RepID=A0A660SFR0_UNCT6|nr:MAG: hypothetical protein DRP43_04345 [candidate division TA06 bacterium]
MIIISLYKIFISILLIIFSVLFSVFSGSTFSYLRYSKEKNPLLSIFSTLMSFGILLFAMFYLDFIVSIITILIALISFISGYIYVYRTRKE